MLTQCARVNPLIKRFFCLLLCVSLLLPTLSFAEDPTGSVEWIDAAEHTDNEDEVFIFETGASVDAPGTVETDTFVDSPSAPEPSPETLCSHENSARIPGGRGTETEWVYETEKYHVRSYEQMYQVVCAACGETLSETTEWQSEQAQHRFDEDGVCKDCKWRSAPVVEESAAETPAPTVEPAEEPEEPAACEHQWQNCEESSEYTAWTAADEAQHSRAHKTALGRVCVTCGAVEHVSDNEETETASHTFDANNVCTECGYQGAGTPEKAPSETEAPQETETPEVTPEPETTPEPEGTSEPENTAVPEITPEPEITSEPDVTVEPENTVAPEITPEPEKTMVDGVQEGGPNEVEMQLLQGEDANAIMLLAAPSLELSGCLPEHNRRSFQINNNYSAWAWLNASEHYRTYDMRQGVYCADCNLTFYMDTVQQKQFLPHQFDGDTCTVCGGHTSCTHEKTWNKVFERGRAYTYQYIDENTHQYGVMEVTQEICSTCGFIVHSAYEVIWKEENHSLTENGKCQYCGYNPECKHPNVIRNERGYGTNFHYEYVDAKQHLWYRTVAAYYYCPDCNTSWNGEVSEEEDSVLAAHTWISGFCLQCGAAQACTHENITITEKLALPNEFHIEDEHWHSGRYYRTECTVCLECGETLSQIPVGSEVKVEAHNFDSNGTCGRCNYTCSHEHTSERLEKYTGNTRYEIVDERRHQYVGDAIVRTYCLVCRTTLNTQNVADYVWDMEGHVFNEENICSRCGYKKEESCTHVNTYVQETQQNVAPFVYMDEQHHTAMVCKTTTTYCANCGITLKTEQKKQTEPVLENHVYYNNSNHCMRCGTAPVCQHENTRTYERTSGLYGVDGYSYVNETQHIHYSNLQEVTVCEECGVTIFIKTLQRIETLEPHFFQDSKYCDCGFKNPCKHESTKIIRCDYNPIRSPRTPVDATHHRVIYHCRRICTECFSWTMWEIYSEYGLEEHTFNNNVCTECGYQIKCDHSETYLGLEKEINKRDFNVVDSSLHAYTCDIVKEILCAKCGECVGEKETNVTEQRTEKHILNWTETNTQHQCRDCGYEIHCLHKNREREKEYTRSTKTIRRDELQHTLLYDTNPRMNKCLDCGMYVDGDDMGDCYEVTSPHTFNENGVCTVCSYRRVCSHEQTTVRVECIDETKKKYIPLDDTQHQLVAPVRVTTYCTQCDETLTVEQVDEYVLSTLDHTFGADDVCSECGYKRACAHKQTSVRVECTDSAKTKYVPLNEEQHQQVGPARVTTYCILCNQTLGTEEFDEYVLYTLGHTFRGTDTCDRCGYRKETPCAHEKTVTVYKAFYSGPCVYVNEDVHTMVKILHRDIYCEICNSLLSCSGEKTDQTVELPHAFSGGKCSCGYADPNAACTHESTVVQTQRNEYSGFKYVDNTQHAKYGDIVTAEICADCGKTLKRQITEKNVLLYSEPHSGFHGDGKCEGCGYMPECKHANIEISKQYMATDAFAIDNAKHRYCLHYFKTLVCKDCGFEVAKVDEFVEETKDEAPHTFVNGVCTECEYQIQCAHKVTRKGLEKQVNLRDYLLKDAEGHTYTYDRAWEILCADCGEKVGEEVFAVGAQGNEAHRLNAQGKCSLCVYLSDCTHSNILHKENVSREGERKVVPASETAHVIINVTGSADVCADCGKILLTYGENKMISTRATHTFNENGICTECGYRKAIVQPTVTPSASAQPTLPPLPVTSPQPTARPLPTQSVYYGHSTSSALQTALDITNLSEAQSKVSDLKPKGYSLKIMDATVVFSEEEYKTLITLSDNDQLTVMFLSTLTSAGYDTAVKNVLQIVEAETSAKGISLLKQVIKRIDTLTKEEKAELEKKVRNQFTIEEHSIEGVTYVYLKITLCDQNGSKPLYLPLELYARRDAL